MSNQVGLWIDHKSAVIVSLTDNGEDVAHISSYVEKWLRRSGDSPLQGSQEPQQRPANNRRERMFKARLNGYYDSIIDSLLGARSVLIFGPGGAKGELNERLKDKRLDARIVGVETTDRLTDREIAAKVRGYFASHRIH